MTVVNFENGWRNSLFFYKNMGWTSMFLTYGHIVWHIFNYDPPSIICLKYFLGYPKFVFMISLNLA